MSNDKADGWVAWHPKSGVTIACLSKTACEHKLSGAKHENFQRYEEFSIAHETGLNRALDDGWRIRPVKLQFLDEPEADGWISVKERLPEVDDGYYYVVALKREEHEYWEDEYSSIARRISTRQKSVYLGPQIVSREELVAEWEERGFTHWMPLPEAPLDNENKKE